MLTLFSIPKPFQGHEGIIQLNAARSWRALGTDVQVILCGRDEGVAEVCDELGFEHLSDVAVNEYGTPLLGDVFRKVHEHARHSLLAYTNADIIFFSHLRGALRKLPSTRFLAVGRRYNVDINDLWSFEGDWETALLAHYDAHGGHNSGYGGSDYFIFRRDTGFEEIPDFAVGRPGWDNWMFARALKAGMPLIDASYAIWDVHQNHGYGHVKASRGVWNGPEGDRNLALCQTDHRYNLLNTTHLLSEKGLHGPWSWQMLLHRLHNLHYAWPDRPRLVQACLRARNIGLRLAKWLRVEREPLRPLRW